MIVILDNFQLIPTDPFMGECIFIFIVDLYKSEKEKFSYPLMTLGSFVGPWT
jgi:hypothetical protein